MRTETAVPQVLAGLGRGTPGQLTRESQGIVVFLPELGFNVPHFVLHVPIDIPDHDQENDGLNISDFIIRKEIIRGCLLNVKKKMYKLKHFPDKDFTGSMHRMAKPGKRSAAPWAKAALLLGDHLKRVDGRLKRPAGTFIAKDQDRLAAVKA